MKTKTNRTKIKTEVCNEERVVLTVEQALQMLPDKDIIHTFYQGPVMLGADWDAEDVKQELRKSIRIELSGEIATSMNHGLCFWQGEETRARWVFVETKH